MMRTVLLLACILSAFTVSLCDWHHPHYSFRCLEDGSVDLYGLHVGSNLNLENRTSNCTNETFSTAYKVGKLLEPVKIPYECLRNVADYSTIKIVVDDPDFDRTTSQPSAIIRRKRDASNTTNPKTESKATNAVNSTTTAKSTNAANPTTTAKSTNAANSTTATKSTNAANSTTTAKSTNAANSTTATKSTNAAKYIGGRGTHKFTIKCRDIPPEGINKTVAHVFKETESNELPENYKEVDGVEMRFKAVNNIKAPDISSIYVGDEFYMFIKYMGKKSYSLVPRRCDAIEGTMVPKDHTLTPEKSVVLWNYRNNGDCVQHSELLEQFHRFNSSLVYTKMYGFRFSGSKYITITCDVTMYPPKPNKNGTCVPSTSRRKRSIELNTHHVFKRIQVFDSKNSYQSENNSQCNHCGLSVWIVAFITTTLFRRWL